jgi:hypothetical protein
MRHVPLAGGEELVEVPASVLFTTSAEDSPERIDAREVIPVLASPHERGP